MEAIELIAYGVQPQFQSRNTDPHNLIYIVYRYRDRLYCYAKPGRYSEVKRLSHSAANEPSQGHEQVIGLLNDLLTTQRLQAQQHVNDYTKIRPKKKSWLSKIVDWFYEVEMPDDLPEV